MSLFLLLKTVHVLAAIAWFGGGFTVALLDRKLADAPLVAQAHYARAAASIGGPVFGAAGGIALLTGIGMVLNQPQFAFEQLFVVIGFLGFAGGSFVGARLISPAFERVAAAAEAGDATGVSTQRAIARRFVLLDQVALLVVVAAMVGKWGL